MAKIAFGKLGLTKNTDTVSFDWNGQKVEVKKYLPLEEKLGVIDSIINKSADDNNFYNPCKIQLFTVIEVVLAYAEITVTEKQKEDFIKFYDLIVGSGFAKIVLDIIPEDELKSIVTAVNETIKSFYSYKNSVVGVLDTVNKDYGDIEYQAKNLNELIENEEKTGLIKKIADNFV